MNARVYSAGDAEVPDLHHAAADGYAVAAAHYETGRPDYPAELDRWLRGELSLRKGKIALDLGSGTGKFLPHLRHTEATIVAVEPVAAMLKQLLAGHPGIEAKQGTAEAIPLADASIDVVVCAQSFHWFATAQALKEIHRVLKTGGVLGLVWNIRDEAMPWVADLRRIFDAYQGDAPRFHTQNWRKVFPAAGFTPLSETRFLHGHTGPPQHVIIDRVLSTSFIAALPAVEQSHIAAQLWQAIASTPELAGKREVTMPYVTAAYSCQKLA